MGAGKSKQQSSTTAFSTMDDVSADPKPVDGLTADQLERRRKDAPYRRSLDEIIADRERDLEATAQRRREGKGIQYGKKSKGGKRKKKKKLKQ